MTKSGVYLQELDELNAGHDYRLEMTPVSVRIHGTLLSSAKMRKTFSLTALVVFLDRRL